MAWTETCKIDFRNQIDHKTQKEGISVREALRVLSEESGIPIGTLVNWKYERTAAKPIDIQDFMLDKLIRDFNVPEEKVTLKLSAALITTWLQLDEKDIINWYWIAFDELGKSLRLTDGWRVGYIRCHCSICDGRVVRLKTYEWATMTPRLKQILSKRGYVNFNAI